MLKGTLLGIGGSDEVHEDVVLHDAGLQARLGDRAPGTPTQQHLTWGAVGKGLHLPVVPGALRGPGAASSHLLWESKALNCLGSPGGTHQRHFLAPSGHKCAVSHKPLGTRPPKYFSSPQTMIPSNPRKTRRRGGSWGELLLGSLVPCPLEPPRSHGKPTLPESQDFTSQELLVLGFQPRGYWKSQPRPQPPPDLLTWQWSPRGKLCGP